MTILKMGLTLSCYRLFNYLVYKGIIWIVKRIIIQENMSDCTTNETVRTRGKIYLSLVL